MEVVLMKKFTEEITAIIESGVTFEEYQYLEGLKEREIYFNNEVDLNIVNRIVYNIMKWNKEDDEAGIPIEKRKPIKLYITSNGGCVISGWSVIDAIKASRTPVHTIGVAVCASMGALLLMAGHHRKCYKNTTILIHDGSLHLASTSKKAKQTMAFYDELEERIKEFVLKNTKISEELYLEKEDEEWYMFGDQALKLGIVDELIE
jgi:ATP-dependent Clp protease, protease subunit